MPSGFSRRNLLLQMGAAALTPAIVPLASAQQGEKPWWLGDGMPQESAATPKIACAIDLHNGVTDEAIRSVVQIGVATYFPADRRSPGRRPNCNPRSTNSERAD